MLNFGCCNKCSKCLLPCYPKGDDRLSPSSQPWVHRSQKLKLKSDRIAQQGTLFGMQFSQSLMPSCKFNCLLFTASAPNSLQAPKALPQRQCLPNPGRSKCRRLCERISHGGGRPLRNVLRLLEEGVRGLTGFHGPVLQVGGVAAWSGSMVLVSPTQTVWRANGWGLVLQHTQCQCCVGW